MVRIGAELFRANNISVTFEWAELEEGFSYGVIVTPVAVSVSAVAYSPESASVELTLLYNVQYDVNITASLCGRSNITTTTTKLTYGEFTFVALFIFV